VRDPLVGLLTQGITADRIALTLAVGASCSLFPFLGTTTALNLAAGQWLRLNHPLLQTLNYLLTPVADFLHRFGWAGVHAFSGWLLTTPFLFAGLYFGLRPALRHLASKTTTGT
jgi:hypothetical protein